jgi:DNA-binding MurR/RpiR family transcriptional regulator
VYRQRQTISHSGSTKEILEAVRQAKQKGARIVSITNYSKSPLADLSDLVVSTGIWEQALQAEVGTRLPFYFLIELLCIRLLAVRPKGADYIQITSDSVSSRLL